MADHPLRANGPIVCVLPDTERRGGELKTTRRCKHSCHSALEMEFAAVNRAGLGGLYLIEHRKSRRWPDNEWGQPRDPRVPRRSRELGTDFRNHRLEVNIVHLSLASPRDPGGRLAAVPFSGSHPSISELGVV